MSYKDDLLCETCHKGKQNSFTNKNSVSTSRPLQLLHLDLFGPTKTTSINGKRYELVIVDNYSRSIWLIFLNHKDESFDIFFKFCKHDQNKKGVCIISIRSDLVDEFENDKFQLFCDENGIFQHQELLNKMEQLKERIYLSMR